MEWTAVPDSQLKTIEETDIYDTQTIDTRMEDCFSGDDIQATLLRTRIKDVDKYSVDVKVSSLNLMAQLGYCTEVQNQPLTLHKVL
jgi:hypothetical protein